MPRQVLHVIPGIAPRYGGPSAAVIEMCRALRPLHVDTLVATTDADGPARLRVMTGRVTAYDGCPTIVFRRHGSDAFKWSHGMARWLRRNVGQFDVVHVHGVFSHSSLAAGRACLAARTPFVIRPLGTLDPWNLRHHGLRKQVLFALGLKRVLAGASAIHYTCLEEQRRTEEALPWLPQGVVVPLGASEALFPGRPDPDRSAPYVLTLSRLDENKGLDLLIDAFHEVGRDTSYDAWRLVIAGDGAPAYVTALRQRAAAGPCSARISLVGWIDGRSRETLLRHASLFALPSRQESFGIGLVDALARGVPAIVTPGVNLGGDVVAAGAGWRTDRSRQALVDVLRAAMADARGRDQRAEAAQVFAQRFRWPAIGLALVSLYDTLGRGQREPHQAPVASSAGSR